MAESARVRGPVRVVPTHFRTDMICSPRFHARRLATLFVAITTLFLGGSAHAASPPRIGGGYYGDMVTHPGGYAGAAWQLAEADAFSFSLGADLGAYHHRRNHTGAFLRGNLSTRIASRRGLFVEPRFDLGYLHTWVAGDGHWEADTDTGQVRQVTNVGAPNLTMGIGVGLGLELDSGLAFVLRPQMSGRAPSNAFVLAQYALLAGFEWQLGGTKR